MLATVGDEEIAAMVRHHHERIDGNGYPDGLAGSQIPLGARIIAVADTFDAITSNRSYRAACTHKRALDVLSEEAGKQLDAEVVAAFQSRYSARRSVTGFALAATAPGRLLAGLQAATQAGASVLPAAGAAALLALSPGLQGGSPASPASHAPPSPAAAVSPVAVTSAPILRAVSRSGGPPTTHRRQARPPAGTAPSRPSGASAQTPTAAAPSSTLAGAPHPTVPESAPPVHPPIVVPPVTPPPAPPVPPLPPTPPIAPPTVTPPVTLPAVPEVHVPPVQIPTLPGADVLPHA